MVCMEAFPPRGHFKIPNGKNSANDASIYER